MERPTATHKFLSELSEAQLTRRNFLKRASILGIATVGFSSLLAACADDDEDPDEDISADETDTEDAEPEEDEVEVEPEDEPEEEEEEEEEETEEPDEEDEAEEEPAGEAASGGEVRWHYGRSPRTFNPLFSTSNREHAFQALVYGALARFEDGDEPALHFAETMDVSEDATSYTFQLYEGITFTDGEPFTTDDVRFTFERAIIPATGSVWRGGFLEIQGAEEYSEETEEGVSGIETPDDLTITFNLVEPNALFLLTICRTGGFGILPKHVLEDVAPESIADHEYSMAPTVTAGSFKFVQYAEDQYMEFERNDDYFGDLPNIDRIIGVIVEPSVALAQLESGEIDVVPVISHDEFERTQQLENVTTNSVRSTTPAAMMVNLNKPYFQDVRVRQAMMYAMDNPGIVEAALQGEGRVVYSPIVSPEWTDDFEDLNPYEYDPERAQELLDEAGWDGSQVLELLHEAQAESSDITAMTIIQQQWSEVGIQVELVPTDTAELNLRTLDDDDFDFRWEGGAVAHPDSLVPRLTPSGFPPEGINYPRYENERVTEIFSLARAEADPDEQFALYNELAQIINEELPILVVYSTNNLSAVSNRVGGFTPPTMRDNAVWQAADWYIDE
jgi:ABC-type transport system substrate-binding protein